MYTVYADNKLLYHPSLSHTGYDIYNTSLVCEDNRAGQFRFTLPVDNNLFNSLEKMTSVIQVFDDSELIFQGRVLDEDRDFNNNKVITCESELSFLLDTVIRPQVIVNKSIAEFLTLMITQHNSQVPESKRFTVGTVDVLPDERLSFEMPSYEATYQVIFSNLVDAYGGHIVVRYANGVRYLDYIESYNNVNSQVIRFAKNILDLSQYVTAEKMITRLIPLGGTYSEPKNNSEVIPGTVLRTVESDDIDPKNGAASPIYQLELKVALNSINQSTKKSNITVTLGIRAKVGTASWSGLSSSKMYARILVSDKSKKTSGVASITLNDPETYTTICTWTGDVKNDNITIKGEIVNKYGKDSKPTSTGVGSTIDFYSAAQKTVYTTIASVNDGKDYIDDADSQALYGIICRTNVWSDILDPALLMAKATDYLTENAKLSINIDISAIDLAMLETDYTKIHVGDSVRIVSTPHNVDDFFDCKRISIDLQDPQSNIYSFGKDSKSLTASTVNGFSQTAVIGDILDQVTNDLDDTDNLVENINAAVEEIYNSYSDVQTKVNNLDADYADIEFANIGTAAINNLFSNSATISYLAARYATIESLQAVEADIDNLETNKLDADAANITQAFIDTLKAGTATITGLDAAYATIANLNAANANITALQTGKLDADLANITTAAIQSLFTNTATINALNAAYLRVDATNITQATIDTLKAGTATIDGLDASYADIDLANISQAGIERMFVDTALLTNVTIEDGVVTGVLNGVEIHGDLITGGTIAADKLIIRGEDGLYYQLNVTGSEVSAEHINEEQYKNKLDGTAIVAKSLTANQIAANTITGNEIMAESITANELSSGAVTTDKLAANAVTANKIDAGAITSDKIAANAITFSLLESSVQNDLNDANTLAQHIKIANGEITITAEDENSNEEFKMRLAARNLRFIENTNTLTAWLAGRQEGLGAAMISVGPPDEINEDGSTDASKIDKRWRISVSDDGTRFRISRHEENVE